MYPAAQDNAGPLTPIVFQCERSNNRPLHLLQPQQHRAVRLHPIGYALISHTYIYIYIYVCMYVMVGE